MIRELFVLPGHEDLSGAGLGIAAAARNFLFRRLVQPGERAFIGRLREGQLRELGRLERHHRPAGDGRVVVAAARRVAPAFPGILRGDQEVDGFLGGQVQRVGGGHAVAFGQRERGDRVVVEVLWAARADAALGILLIGQPAKAFLHGLADV